MKASDTPASVWRGGSPRMKASEGRAREPRDEGDEAGLLWGSGGGPGDEGDEAGLL